MAGKYENDLIADMSDSVEQGERYQKYLAEAPKAPGWLPFPRYQMIQTGYPVADHGEMISHTDVGTDAEGRILPFLGMWCKVEDVRPIVEQRDNLRNSLENLVGLIENLSAELSARGLVRLTDLDLTLMPARAALQKARGEAT